jgi:hypothetical protein
MVPGDAGDPVVRTGADVHMGHRIFQQHGTFLPDAAALLLQRLALG